MRAGNWALLILLSLFWGGSFIFIELALASFPPLTVVLGRVALAAFALYLYLRLTGLPLPHDPRLWRAFFVMGLLNNLIPFSLIAFGQQSIDAGLASILNATMPIYTVLLAHWLTQDEQLSSSKMLGVLLGLAGVVVLIGIDSLKGMTNDVLAQLAIVGAALCYAMASIYGKRFASFAPAQTATGTLIATTLMMLLPAVLIDQPWLLTPTSSSLIALVALALISTAAAYLIYYFILSTAGSTYASLVTLLIPPSAILLSSVFLDETIGAQELLGLALIMLGLLAIDGKLLRLLFVK